MSRPTVLPDQAARDLIEARLDLNLLVEAGAGSGKTESLARRMAAGIIDGRYMVEQMAAVTFTRKAAAELRGRFQFVLEDRLGKEPDATRRARIEEALTHLERLFAGTIHAFCAHLIRERPVEAGMAPGFTELDEGQDAELRGQIWREFIDLKRASESALLQELVEAGIRPSDLDGAFGKVCTFSDVTFVAGETSKPDPQPAQDGFNRFWSDLEVMLPSDIPHGVGCALQALARETKGRLRMADLSCPQQLAEFLARWETHPDMRQLDWPGTPKQRKETKAALDALIDDFQTTTVQPYLTAWRSYVYRLAVMLLQEGRAHLVEVRKAALSLNYEDLLQVVARLLRENAEVRAALQRKYRWVFVDEFQDTDPIQAELIFLLAAQPDTTGTWADVALRPGALFIVGDPKQSIYRFRRADIDTYQQVRQRIADTGGRVVSLTASFRSVPSLCAWANGVFSQIFPNPATPQQPTFHGLHPVRDDLQGQPGGVRILTIVNTVSERAVPDTEAQRIAAFIRTEVDAGRRRPGDFLILTRKKRALGRYASALERLCVPVEVSGASALAESPAVASLVMLLRVLADPDDGPASIGVLRGPLFGLSDEALFEYRQTGASFLLTAPLPAHQRGPVTEALSVLQGMYAWTRTLPAPAAIERILERTGLLALAATASQGGTEAGALLQALDLVRQGTECGSSLANVVTVLEEALESANIETVPLEPGQQDVVRIMNLHKAKGLEATVVFLADPMGGVPPRTDLRIVRAGVEALGYFQLTRPLGQWGRAVIGEPAEWAAHEAAELEYVMAEESRLLYVACTRAKELLIIGRWAKDGGRGTRPWAPLEPYLVNAAPLPDASVVSPDPSPLPDLSSETRMAAEEDRQGRRARILKPSWQMTTVTALAHSSHSVGRPAADTRQRGPDTGVAWGTLIHALLEQAMRNPLLDRAGLHRLAVWLTVDDPELTEVISIALDTVEQVKLADCWRDALAAEERMVEVPFCVSRADGETQHLLSGVVDMLYRNANGWHLIDYKTDQLSMEVLSEQYGDQIRHYAKHWSSLAGGHLAYAGLYSVREQRLSSNLMTG